MALEIVRSNTDGMTGHISVHVRAVEELSPGQISKGPLEVVGIDHESLMRIYHPTSQPITDDSMDQAIGKWLAAHHRGAVQRKRAIESSSRVVDRLKGRVMKFGDEVSG